MLNSAIISVYKKDKLDELLSGLNKINPDIEIISSGGTARKIDELGYGVTEVSFYTGFPESPGGLVKTLHPRVHAGILLDPSRSEERKYLEDHNIKSIDFIACNLYPFQETIDKKAPYQETVEMIDIGGPTLVRSGAKGCMRRGGKPITIVDPDDYKKITEELEQHKILSTETVYKLVDRAFKHTRDYDTQIAEWTDVMVSRF